MSASSVTGDEEEKNFRLLLPQRLPKYAHPVIGRRGPNYIRLRLIAPTAARCKRERERKKKREEGKNLPTRLHSQTVLPFLVLGVWGFDRVSAGLLERV